MSKFKKIISKYSSKFSEGQLFSLISNSASRLGGKVIYTGLLLYYAYNRQETPMWARNIILGTLGYLVNPIDAVPDLTPFLGYTDDIGVMSFGLVTIASYVNNDIKEKAKNTLSKWLPSVDQSQLLEIDDKL